MNTEWREMHSPAKTTRWDDIPVEKII
ncbi:DUF4113 domain-containing protein [Pantoea brenneri]|nr:DUF4113 domain-containing protein [Pantoea brenneri]MDH1089049.1 DUF4113 domain-containing protein [Pantoea brenneri]